MTAQLEEVIVATDLRDLQHFGPDPCQGVFHRALRGLETTAEQRVPVRLRQSLAVQLAVGGQRQRLQPDIGRRHHVVRQPRLQILAQRLDIHGLSGAVVGHQALVARRHFTHQDRRIPHLRVLAEAGLDLARLDTETADLHLVVVAAQVLQGAVAIPAGPITAAIHQAARLRIERVGDKRRGRQLRPVQVPLGHTSPTNVQLARHAHRHRLLPGIEHVGTGVADRTPDRNAARAGLTDLEGGREGGGFGWPVAIEQVLRSPLPQHPLDHCRVQHIAADDQVAQFAERFQQALGVLMEQPRRHPQDADRLLVQQRGECLAGQQHILVDHHHRPAVEQWGPDFQGTGVERRVRGEGHAVVRVEVGITIVDHQPGDRPVRHQHALRCTGGAGGVHDVRHRLRQLRQGRVVFRLALERQVIQVDTAGRTGQGFIAMSQERHGLAVAQHEILALGRGIDIQRHVDRRALADRQLADQQVQRARQQSRYRVTRPHAQPRQMMRQAVGPAIELAVAEGLAAMHGRQRLGMRLYPLLEPLMQGLLGRIVAPGGIETLQQLVALFLCQHRQFMQRRGRRLFQGTHQVLQGTLHVIADTLRIGLRHRLDIQREAFAQVVDIEHQRVVAALAGLEQVNALPHRQIVGRALSRCAVAIIEQAAEQRQHRRYATATLRKRQ